MKKRWLLPLLLILILSLAACNDVETPTDDTTEMDPNLDEKANESPIDEGDIEGESDEDSADESSDSDDMTYEDITLSPQDAVDKFMEAHPDSKVNEVTLDENLTDYQYKIEGYDDDNDYEVKINPVSGDIISDDEELIDLDDDKGEITKDHISKIGTVADKAMEEAGDGAKMKEWSLEFDDGKLILEIELQKDNNDLEYTYDLESEKLIEKDD